MHGVLALVGCTSLRTILGGFSNIYFRGLGLTGLQFGLWLEFVLGLWLVWCYGQGQFRVRASIRVRVGFLNMFGAMVMVMVSVNTYSIPQP